MRRAAFAVLALALAGCHLDALLRAPEPPSTRQCTLAAYWVRNGTDTTWLGTQEVACPNSTRRDP